MGLLLIGLIVGNRHYKHGLLNSNTIDTVYR